MRILRWAAGIAIGLGLWLVSYVVGFTIYALAHTATGLEPPQEPDPIYTDGFTIEHDGITDVCRPAGDTFICTEEK